MALIPAGAHLDWDHTAIVVPRWAHALSIMDPANMDSPFSVHTARKLD